MADACFVPAVHRPTNAEYRCEANTFIYCTNASCSAARTGLSRVHLGPNRAGTCFRCNKPFPERPNGETHGYAHYAALLAGKPGGSTVVYYKGNSGKAAGKGNGGKAAGKGKGGKGSGGGSHGGGGDRLDKLTELVATLATNMSNALGANKQTPTINASSFPVLEPGGPRVGWGQAAALVASSLLPHPRPPRSPRTLRNQTQISWPRNWLVNMMFELVWPCKWPTCSGPIKRLYRPRPVNIRRLLKNSLVRIKQPTRCSWIPGPPWRLLTGRCISPWMHLNWPKMMLRKSPRTASRRKPRHRGPGMRCQVDRLIMKLQPSKYSRKQINYSFCSKLPFCCLVFRTPQNWSRSVSSLMLHGGSNSC